MIAESDIALTPTEQLRLRAWARHRADERGSRESLMDFIPRVLPGHASPRHLAGLVDLIERAEREPVRAVVSTPPQHGKTTVLLSGLARALRRDGRPTHAYATYSATQARSKAHLFREIAREAGVAASADLANLDEWRTVAGGGLLATSVEGPLTGQAVTGILAIDDPLKDRIEAESALRRQQVWEWWQSVARTRLHPSASVLVVMARWHPDDLAGRLIDAGWDALRLPAVDDAGDALWPEKFPAGFLRQTERDVGDYTWASLYQGQPRPRGGAVFRDAHYYDEPPTFGYRLAVGADFAYTRRTHADYSVGILAAEWRGSLYVLDVIRHQVSAPQFAAALSAMGGRGQAAITAIVSGTERGTVDFMVQQGLPVEAITATADKFVRAQPVAAAWNAGRVLLPRQAPWLEAFIAEVCGFTGVSDSHDDQVDALAAAHLALLEGAGMAPLSADLAAELDGLGG